MRLKPLWTAFSNSISFTSKNTLAPALPYRTCCPLSPVLWRPTKSRNPYNVKPFLTDISATVAQIQKFQKTRCIFFEFCFCDNPPHPVNWSPTHSTGPQTPFFFFRYLGRSNQKIKKKRCIFSNFASGRTLPTQAGPQPIQLVPNPNPLNWSPNIVFYRYLGISRSNIFFFKDQVHFFQILLLEGPSPPSQLVPNPFNWSPNTLFYR